MKLLGHESPCWKHFHWEFRENSFSNKIDGSCIAYFIVQKVRFNSDYESTKVVQLKSMHVLVQRSPFYTDSVYIDSL